MFNCQAQIWLPEVDVTIMLRYLEIYWSLVSHSDSKVKVSQIVAWLSSASSQTG